MSTLPERLASKFTEASGDECWLWHASTRGGYGQVRVGTRVRAAHLVIYELLRGPVPDGLVLDHLCRQPRCVNPDHLEPVTRGENVLRGVGPTAVNARKVICIRGHVLRERPGAAHRWCWICRSERPRNAAAGRRRRNAAAA